MSDAIAPIVIAASLEFTPRTVTGPDADGGSAPIYAVPGVAQGIRIGVSSNTGSATLALRIYFLSSTFNVIGVQSVSFLAGSLPDFNGRYTGTPLNFVDACWPLIGAKAIGIKVDAVTMGSWILAGAMG